MTKFIWHISAVYEWEGNKKKKISLAIKEIKKSVYDYKHSRRKMKNFWKLNFFASNLPSDFGAGGLRVAQFVLMFLLPSHCPFIAPIALSASCKEKIQNNGWDSDNQIKAAFLTNLTKGTTQSIFGFFWLRGQEKKFFLSRNGVEW